MRASAGDGTALLVVCCLVLGAFGVVTSQSVIAELLPLNPIVLVGEPLSMSCTLLPTLSSDSPAMTSDDLFLQFDDDVSEGRHYVIDERYVTRPDNVTLLLNMTAQSDMKRGLITCFARNHVTEEGVPIPLSTPQTVRVKSYSDRAKADLLPNDPTVLDGEPLVVNCTLTESYGVHPITSADLYLQLGQHEIDERYVSRPNDVTLLLNMTAHMNMTGGHVFCYARNFTTDNGNMRTLVHQVITVLRRPMTPVIDQCLVENWSKMTCTWSPTVQEQRNYTGLDVTQRLYWILRHDQNTFGDHPCIQGQDECDKYVSECPYPDLEHENNCTWVHPDPKKGGTNNYFRRGYQYAMFINIELHYPDSDTRLFLDTNLTFIRTKFQVKPDPPSTLDVKDVGAWNATIKWSYPTGATDTHLHYAFVIEQLSDDVVESLNFTWTDSDLSSSEYKSKKKEIVLDWGNRSNLNEPFIRPNTEYLVSVSCIPYFYPDDLHGVQEDNMTGIHGHWSDPKKMRFKTLPAVPDKVVELSAGLFDRKEISNGIDVRIYWNEMPRMYLNGQLRSYNVHYVTNVSQLTSPSASSGGGCDCPLDSCVKVSSDAAQSPSAHLSTLDASTSYSVFVEMVNDVGCNRFLRHSINQSMLMLIPARKLMPPAPTHFVVQWNKTAGSYRANWKHGNTSNIPLRYTIYYCLSDFEDCEFGYKSRTTAGSKTQFTFVNLAIGVEYEFRLSAEYARTLIAQPPTFTSSGLVFTVTKCIYDIEQDIQQPLVHYAPPVAGGIGLQFAPTDDCKDEAYIEYYHVVYWPVGKLSKQKELNVSATVEQRGVERYVIAHLPEDADYNVKVRAVSPWQQSAYYDLGEFHVPGESSGLGMARTALLSILIIFIVLMIPACFFIYRYARGKFRKFRRLPITLPDISEEVPLDDHITGDARDDTKDADDRRQSARSELQPFLPTDSEEPCKDSEFLYSPRDSAVGSSTSSSPEADTLRKPMFHNLQSQPAGITSVMPSTVAAADSSYVKDVAPRAIMSNNTAPYAQTTSAPVPGVGMGVASAGASPLGSGITPYSMLKDRNASIDQKNAVTGDATSNSNPSPTRTTTSNSNPVSEQGTSNNPVTAHQPDSIEHNPSCANNTSVKEDLKLRHPQPVANSQGYVAIDNNSYNTAVTPVVAAKGATLTNTDMRPHDLTAAARGDFREVTTPNAVAAAAKSRDTPLPPPASNYVTSADKSVQQQQQQPPKTNRVSSSGGGDGDGGVVSAPVTDSPSIEPSELTAVIASNSAPAPAAAASTSPNHSPATLPTRPALTPVSGYISHDNITMGVPSVRT